MKSKQSSSLNKSTNLNLKNLMFKVFISPKKTTRFLLSIVFILVLLSIITQASVYLLPDFLLRDFIAIKFNLNGERNFPALYSSIALLFCSGLFWIIAQYKKISKDKYTVYWKTLCFIFIFLALDELLSFHEILGEPFNQLGFDGILHHAWVVPGMTGVGIFFIVFYRFFQHLPQYMKQLMLRAFSVFIGGVIIVETFGGYYKYLYGAKNLGYVLLITIEESMEMLGFIILIHALILYINQIGMHSIDIKFNDDNTLEKLY